MVTSGKHLIKRLRFWALTFFLIVQIRGIKNVPFPAVTVCPPYVGSKWKGIDKVLRKLDKNGKKLLKSLYKSDSLKVSPIVHFKLGILSDSNISLFDRKLY